jgi:tetratricopeptide (TPR) repeat protein
MNSYPQPPWLPVAPDPPGRTAVVEHTCALLAAHGAMVSLVGAPGTGATTVAGAVAMRMSKSIPVCCLRLAGCSELPQLFHAIGFALGASFPRDQAAVCETLREAGPTLLVLDDADQPDTATAVERLAAVAPEARFLTVGRSPVFQDRLVHLSPLLGTEGSELDPALNPDTGVESGAGNLVLRYLLQRPTGEDPWGFLDDLPEGADLLASFPAGIPGGRPRGVPANLLLPTPAGRTTLRRCVAEALLARRRLGERELALALLPRCGQLLRVAEEPSLASAPHPADLAVVAFLAEHHPDAGEASRARAAWSRFVVAAGQASAGRVWRDDEQLTGERGRYGALLAWAEGDALLAEGDVDPALVAFELAASQLRRAGEVRQLAAFHLRCADRLQARAAFDSAAEHAQEARDLFDSLPDPVGQATVRRCDAAALLAMGLPDEAQRALAEARACLEAPQRPIAIPSSLLLTELALAIVRGEPDRAEELIEQARGSLGSNPFHQGLLAQLQAELALREERPEDAEKLLDRALEHFGRAGDRRALGVALRLQGDCAALSGQLHQAEARYLRATREQVRCGDIHGLARTLEHRRALEAEQGSPHLAERLEELAEELQSLGIAG